MKYMYCEVDQRKINVIFKEFRVTNNRTLTEIANETGIPEEEIQAWEEGQKEISLEKADKLFKNLDFGVAIGVDPIEMNVPELRHFTIMEIEEARQLINKIPVTPELTTYLKLYEVLQELHFQGNYDVAIELVEALKKGLFRSKESPKVIEIKQAYHCIAYWLNYLYQKYIGNEETFPCEKCRYSSECRNVASPIYYFNSVLEPLTYTHISTYVKGEEDYN